MLQLAFIPLYIKFLGIEAYGLIGFYAMLITAAQILDFGLSQTINRELARASAQPENAAQIRNLVRTLEIIYWATGVVVGLVIAMLSPVIATHLLDARSIATETVQEAVLIMGLVMALQWPLGLYHGGLMGLQRQVLQNVIRIGMTTLGSGGAVLVLWLVSPTITAFFEWQILASGIHVAVMAAVVWRCLPKSPRVTRPSIKVLLPVWRFAAGTSGISVSGLLLMQLDKWILVKLLSLETFAYYLLATVVANSLYLFISPIFNGIFPRFSALIAAGEESAIKQLYHGATQLLAVLILPIAAVLSIFSFEVVLLWTGSAETARNAAPIISILAIGTALNGLMNLPYALQIAHGWTSIGLKINAAFILALGPAIFFMATRYGAIGAAVVWPVLNGIYVLVAAPVTHRRLLPGETRRWFLEDIAPALAVAISLTAIGRWLIDDPMSPLGLLAALAAISVIALVAAAWAAPLIRMRLLERWSRFGPIEV